MAPPSPSSSLSAHPSASHSSSASASAATKQPISFPDYVSLNGYDSQGFIYHINIFTLCILALFVLFGLPRLLARFHHRNEYLNGHLLRSVFFPTPSARKPSTKSNRSYRMQHPQQAGPSSDEATNGYDDYDSKEAYSDDDHNSQAHLTSPFSPVSPTSPTETYAYQAYRGNPSAVYPPHVPSCPKLLRPLLVLLRRRVTPGFSWAKLLILTGWFFLLFYAGFYKAPYMPFLDPIRMGWLSIGILPWAYGFSSKNNIIGWLVGKSYEKLNYLHRFAGRIVVLAVNIHAIDYFYKWKFLGTFHQEITQPSHMWGLIALVCADVLWVLSLTGVRQKFYFLFYTSHCVAAIVIIPATWFHYPYPGAHNYLLVCIGLYLLDTLLRLVKTRITTAVIKPIPQLGATKIECPSLTVGWKAGQHVRVRVLSGALGWFGWGSVHPFTIASVEGNTDNGPDGLVMIAKRCSPNGWTDRLYRLADEQRGFHGGRRVKVMVEGPYGGFGHVMPCSYSAMVLYCGGTGISFGIAALKELVQRDLRGECRVKVVRLIWVVTEPKSIMVFLKDFEDVVRRGSKTVSIKIDVYWTRSPTMGAAASANSTNPFGDDFRPKNIYLVSGRPTKAGLGKCLEDVIGITCRLGPPLGSGGPSGGLFSAKNRGRLRGVLVGVCGPREMGDEVVDVVNSVSKEKRERVGGVEVYEEVFGY